MYCGTAFGALQFWRHEVQRAVPSILKNLFGFKCVRFMFYGTRHDLQADRFGEAATRVVADLGHTLALAPSRPRRRRPMPSSTMPPDKAIR